MKKINTQKDLDSLIASPNWSNLSLRECYLLSPSYVSEEENALIAPDAMPAMRVLVCPQDLEFPSVEMLFTKVEDIYMPINCALRPKGKLYRDYIEFSLAEHEDYLFRCHEIYYKFLDHKNLVSPTRFIRERI